MKGPLRKIRDLKIGVRLIVAIWLMITIAWTGTLLWSVRVQRDTLIEHTKDFAQSVHQMTLAGLTGMMITGSSAQRAVFLDQIRQSNNIRSLKVLRGDNVTRQYGPGTADEMQADALEQTVLDGGQSVFRIHKAGDAQIMRAVMPALAWKDYLGKSCLGCHDAAEGAVLGAVSMEISLDKASAAVSAFIVNIFWAAILISVPLMLLIHFSVSRSVTRPLGAMAGGLREIAEGEIDLGHRLPVHGSDEIGEAAAAFNRVMEKIGEMVKAEQISLDVFNNALEGILVTDSNSRILRVNPPRLREPPATRRRRRSARLPGSCSPASTTKRFTRHSGRRFPPRGNGRATSGTGARTARFIRNGSISAASGTSVARSNTTSRFSATSPNASAMRRSSLIRPITMR